MRLDKQQLGSLASSDCRKTCAPPIGAARTFDFNLICDVLSLVAAVPSSSAPSSSVTVLLSLGSGAVAAWLTWLLYHRRTSAEVRKFLTEAEKYEAEATKLRLEAERITLELASARASIDNARETVVTAATAATELLTDIAGEAVGGNDRRALRLILAHTRGQRTLAKATVETVLASTDVRLIDLTAKHLLRDTPQGYELTALGRQLLAVGLEE